MGFVRTLARAYRAVPLVLIVSAGTAEAAPYAGTAEAVQIALSETSMAIGFRTCSSWASRTTRRCREIGRSSRTRRTCG